MRLTESDLKFVIETVATRRRDHDHIIELVRDKEELLEAMLDDPKLAERLVSEEEAFVRVGISKADLSCSREMSGADESRFLKLHKPRSCSAMRSRAST